MSKAKRAVPEGFHTVTPHLIFEDTTQALDWYTRALGAEELNRSAAPDGKIMHAEIRVGNSRMMLNDEMGGGKSARAYGGSPISLWVYVDDCDTMFNRAIAAGAKVLGGPMGQMGDQFWGDRSGSFTDPAGYMWTIATRKEDLTPEEIHQRQTEFMKNFAQQAHS